MVSSSSNDASSSEINMMSPTTSSHSSCNINGVDLKLCSVCLSPLQLSSSRSVVETKCKVGSSYKKEPLYLNNNFTSATSSSCLVVVKLMISMHFMSFAY